MADRIKDPATGLYIREMSGRDGKDTLEQDTISRMFLVYDDADPLKCRDAMINQRVALELDEFANLAFVSMSWKLHAGATKWAFKVDYAQAPTVGGYTVTIDTTGGTAKQTESRSQVAYPAPGESPRSFPYALNVQNDKAEGVDRVIPALKLNIIARLNKSYVTSPIAYAKTVASVTGSVNSATFLTFARGELLFLGGSGQIIGEEPTLTFSFAASSNASNLTIGEISGITKEGHDFIWFDYKVLKDNATNLQISKARAAYVAKVYEYRDFSVLGIGL